MNRFILVLTIGLFTACGTENKPSLESPSDYSEDSSQTQAVIEIPAGTLAKYELNKQTLQIEHQIKDGKPRIVQYLAYPGNYGFIPNTLLSKKNGGDGDPLDVLVLGEAVKRKETIPIQIIGALKLLDGGEQDDKLIAVTVNSPFSEVSSMSELEESFPGTQTIIETWFSNYKGAGKMVSHGFIEKNDAISVLSLAKEEFKEKD